jgi:hypothetical protein
MLRYRFCDYWFGAGGNSVGFLVEEPLTEMVETARSRDNYCSTRSIVSADQISALHHSI